MKKLSLNFLRKFFALRAHGNNLLSPGTEQWMFIARIVVLIMATVESLSWGYLGSLLGNADDKVSKYVMAGMVGGFIFLVVWMVDITLMTLDRYKRYYHRRIFQLEEAESKNKSSILTSFIKENDVQISIVFRIIMVAMSMVITAPFLNQLIFQKEIGDVIGRKQKEIIDHKKQELVKTYDNEIRWKKHKIDSLEERYHAEVSGKGLTKLRGEGSSSKSLLLLIKNQETEIELIRRNKDMELNDYDLAVQDNNHHLLEAKWNLVLPTNSLIERGEAIKELMASPDVRLTETAIRSFLCFLFLAMLLLKFFEPHGVRIYLSEALQQAYISYLNGGFNKWLRVEEQPNGKSPMQPFRFEEFMVNVYPKIAQKEREGINDEVEHDKINRLEKAIEAFQEKRAKLETIVFAESRNIQQEIGAVESNIEKTEALILNLEQEFKHFAAKMEHHDKEIQEMEGLSKSNGLHNGQSSKAKVFSIQAIEEIKSAKTDLRADLHRLEIQTKQAQLRLNNLRTQKIEAYNRLQQNEIQLSKIDEQLEILHNELFKVIVNGAME